MEKIDLTKILKTGDEVYSVLNGKMLSVKVGTAICFPIVCGQLLTKFGQFNLGDGECVIFPSKDQRDWNRYIQNKKSEVKLEEAKLKYPIGTKVCSVIWSLLQGTITGKFKLCSDGDIHAEILDNNRKYDISLYRKYDNKWAEIVKEPLFTTEDGVNVYGEELVWFINKDAENINSPSIKSKDCFPQKYKDLRYFSTEKAALDYIVKNNQLAVTIKSNFTSEQREEIIRLINQYK